MTSLVKRMLSTRTRKGKTEQPASPTAVAALVDGTPKTEVRANGVVPKVLPTFDELPKFHELNGCAWEVWGKDDELGTINLLTEDVVQRAAREEIRCVGVLMTLG